MFPTTQVYVYNSGLRPSYTSRVFRSSLRVIIRGRGPTRDDRIPAFILAYTQPDPLD